MAILAGFSCLSSSKRVYPNDLSCGFYPSEQGRTAGEQVTESGIFKAYISGLGIGNPLAAVQNIEPAA